MLISFEEEKNAIMTYVRKNLLEGWDEQQFRFYWLTSIKLLQYTWSCVHLKRATANKNQNLVSLQEFEIQSKPATQMTLMLCDGSLSLSFFAGTNTKCNISYAKTWFKDGHSTEPNPKNATKKLHQS